MGGRPLGVGAGMDVFDLRGRLVEDYARYTRSFIKIADPRIDGKVQNALTAGALWPEPLLQLNPTFLPGGTIDDLVKDGTLHRSARGSSGSRRPRRIRSASRWCFTRTRCRRSARRRKASRTS